MFHPGSRSRALARRGAVISVALLCTAAGASAAAGATLHVVVAPTTVARKKPFDVKLTGTFRKSETAHGRAFLIAAMQFGPKPCLATAQEENNKRSSQADFYFGKKGGIFKSHSPFTRTDTFDTKLVGSFRICAYLYAKSVRPSDTTRPIARAETTFKVVK